jgi:hypothetical protein
MPKKHRLKPLMALGFLEFNVLSDLLHNNSYVSIFCIEYGLRNIAHRIPVRSGGGSIQWFKLKPLITAIAEADWAEEIRTWEEMRNPHFFLGWNNRKAILAQGAFMYSHPYGLPERKEMESRSAILKQLLDGVSTGSLKFKSALKNSSCLSPLERRALRGGLYSLIKKMRVIDREYFEESDDKAEEIDPLDASIFAEREECRDSEEDDDARPYKQDPHFSELYTLHEHVLSLIIKYQKGTLSRFVTGDRQRVSLDEINLGEVMISRLGLCSVEFSRERLRLSRIRENTWALG